MFSDEAHFHTHNCHPWCSQRTQPRNIIELKKIIRQTYQEVSMKMFIIVWCLTKFMLTTITDFDTALVIDKNSSMDIV